MTLLLALALAGPAQAASLDNLEIGGPWGTPTATDGTAAWWNPAGLAAERGTRIMVEGAPLIGKVTYERTGDPYGYNGTDITHSFGVVPFLGVATDASVKGLGLGLAVFVPYARGGAIENEIPMMSEYPQDGPVPPESSVGRYHLREAKVQAMQAMLGAAYEIQDIVAIGAGGGILLNTWQSRLDSEVLSSFDTQIEDTTGGDSGYTNAMVMDPHYATTIQFSPLHDIAFTFNAGIRVKAIPDMLSIGASYNHGMRVDNTGDMTLNFNCPPETDTLGRFAAERTGICYTTVNAAGSVGYRLPSRASASVLVEPMEQLDVTLMGGWVGWSVFTDYEIGIDDVEARNPQADNPAGLADAVEKDRLRARAAHDSWWAALDVKGQVTPYLLVGGRLLFDKAAIPDEAVSSNNFDANDLMVSGLVAVKPIPWMEIAASYTHHIMETRVITDSGWSVNVEEGAKNEDRWFYPDANGTYKGTISRIGVQLRFSFGQPKEDATEAPETIEEFEEIEWGTAAPTSQPTEVVVPEPTEDLLDTEDAPEGELDTDIEADQPDLLILDDETIEILPE